MVRSGARRNRSTGWRRLAAAVRARALADKAVLGSLTVSTSQIGEAEEALAIAREVGDRPLLARALTACIGAAAFDVQAASPYVAEALEVARELGDQLAVVSDPRVAGLHRQGSRVTP